MISDFLDDQGCERPLQYLADFGHELMLMQVWAEEDRTPPEKANWSLGRSETGDVLKLGLSNETRREYTSAFDAYSGEIRRLAQRNGGRYAGLPSSASLENRFSERLCARRVWHKAACFF